MRIKRYVTADMRQAIRRVRDELGADAVILSSQRTPDGVEVTAAVDYDAVETAAAATAREAAAPGPVPRSSRTTRIERYAGTAQLAPGAPSTRGTAPGPRLEPGSRPAAAARQRADVPRPRTPAATTAGAAGARAAEAASDPDAVGRELRELRGLLESQLARLAWAEEKRAHPRRAGMVARLARLGLRRELAVALAAALPEDLAPSAAWPRALGLLASRLRVTGDELLERGGVVALLGATGVGKTTTVAKLAARFALRHGSRQVALVTTDSYRVGAHEQLRTFGRIIDIPVAVASDEGELEQALEQFYDRRLVLVDTAGMSQRDLRFSQQIRLIAERSPRIRIFLVLSATSQYQGLREVVRAFGGSHLDGCVITKVDESCSLGALLGVLLEHRIPLAYVSDGQRVPEDLHPARAQGLVERAATLAAAPPPAAGALAAGAAGGAGEAHA